MRWHVTVDDPDLAGPHEYEVEAVSEDAARLKAARIAISEDERGDHAKGASSVALYATATQPEIWTVTQRIRENRLKRLPDLIAAARQLIADLQAVDDLPTVVKLSMDKLGYELDHNGD